MKKSLLLVALAAMAALWISLPFLQSLRACGHGEAETFELCRLAVDQNQDDAVKRLRALGPDGFNAMLELYGRALDEHKKNRADSGPNSHRVADVFDRVAGQRDAAWSRLYWHTNLSSAKQEAATAGKPILSLRLLGRLDETLSCANSRYFRTALYANAEISDFLRDKYILHWQSVREVPKITIDFGGGRTIARTITGNSIHYILDANGRAIDALPGLYSPADFLDQLVRAKSWTGELSKMTSQEFAERIAKLHAEAMTNAEENFAVDKAEALNQPKLVFSTDAKSQPAIEASLLSRAKSSEEMPVLKQAGFSSPNEMWQRIATLPRHRASLDGGSKSLLHAQYPDAAKAMPLTVTKMRTEEPILPLLRNFQESLAVDSVRNEYEFHYAIHGWFANGEVPADLDAFNSRVYSELFLTPDSDPWLGLALEDVYTAIPSGGLCETPVSETYPQN